MKTSMWAGSRDKGPECVTLPGKGQLPGWILGWILENLELRPEDSGDYGRGFGGRGQK